MYYEIYCKHMDLTGATEALVHEKLGLLEHLLKDYPAESVMGRVTLYRLPVTDEYYNVRVALELPGDRCYARANGTTLESALINVAAELERQLQHLLSDKRNESHWKRLLHVSETVRRNVPVAEEEVPDIAEEVRQRTEAERHGEGQEHRAA